MEKNIISKVYDVLRKREDTFTMYPITNDIERFNRELAGKNFFIEFGDNNCDYKNKDYITENTMEVLVSDAREYGLDHLKGNYICFAILDNSYETENELEDDEVEIHYHLSPKHSVFVKEFDVIKRKINSEADIEQLAKDMIVILEDYARANKIS